MVLACYQMTLLNNFRAVFVDKALEWNFGSIHLHVPGECEVHILNSQIFVFIFSFFKIFPTMCNDLAHFPVIKRKVALSHKKVEHLRRRESAIVSCQINYCSMRKYHIHDQQPSHWNNNRQSTRKLCHVCIYP